MIGSQEIFRNYKQFITFLSIIGFTIWFGHIAIMRLVSINRVYHWFFFPHRFMATPHLSQGGTVRGEARCLDVLRPHKTSAGSGKIDQFPIGFPNKGVLIIHHNDTY